MHAFKLFVWHFRDCENEILESQREKFRGNQSVRRREISRSIILIDFYENINILLISFVQIVRRIDSFTWNKVSSIV